MAGQSSEVDVQWRCRWALLGSDVSERTPWEAKGSQSQSIWQNEPKFQK